MAHSPDDDEIDDELFQEVYGKVYTGPTDGGRDGGKRQPPPQPPAAAEPKTEKVDGDEEDFMKDPNAIPTDFTSREAKVWEAKAKATERNWKKRKEEELICKICGDSGHFTQGCPSTLGASRKDFFERVPARDKHIKALFSEKVIKRIEKDIGCNIKMEEKFLIVSGKDRLVLSKGVDAVHKVIKEGDKDAKKAPSSSQGARSKSPDDSRLRRSMSQRSQSTPRNQPQQPPRLYRHEKVNEDNVREDLQKLTKGSQQARAYGNEVARHRSRSPRRSYPGEGFDIYGSQKQTKSESNTNNWDVDGRGMDMHPGQKYESHTHPRNLEELEMKFNQEIMDLNRVRDMEEDEENSKHRQTIRDLRESYLKKLAAVRTRQSQQWEDFLHLDAERRQRAAHHHHMAESSLVNFQRSGFSDYDRAAAGSRFQGNLPVDSRSRYAFNVDNYTAARPQEMYGDYPHERREDFGKPYQRY